MDRVIDLRSMDAPAGPTRFVHHAEALAWLAANPAPPRAAVVTSLPDVSETPSRELEPWRAWFLHAARAVVRWVDPAALAIFFQSDIRVGGAWIDKGYLVQRAAEDEGATIVFHKIVCRAPPGTIAVGRPSYSHLIAVTRRPAARVPRHPGPDVLGDAGAMSWSKAMGESACRLACQFLKDETDAQIVVDPFCGRGTVLAVANSMGFAAIGVELVAKRCRQARGLKVEAP
jgi:hypothetical protein